MGKKAKALELALESITEKYHLLRGDLEKEKREHAQALQEIKAVTADCLRLRRQLKEYEDAPEDANPKRTQEILSQTLMDWHKAERKVEALTAEIAALKAPLATEESKASIPLIEEWVPLHPPMQKRSVVRHCAPTTASLKRVRELSKETI